VQGRLVSRSGDSRAVVLELIGGFGDRNDLAERLKIIFQQA
jgi:hypothetical protein